MEHCPICHSILQSSEDGEAYTCSQQDCNYGSQSKKTLELCNALLSYSMMETLNLLVKFDDTKGAKMIFESFEAEQYLFKELHNGIPNAPLDVDDYDVFFDSIMKRIMEGLENNIPHVRLITLDLLWGFDESKWKEILPSLKDDESKEVSERVRRSIRWNSLTVEEQKKEMEEWRNQFPTDQETEESPGYGSLFG